MEKAVKRSKSFVAAKNAYGGGGLALPQRRQRPSERAPVPRKRAGDRKNRQPRADPAPASVDRNKKSTPAQPGACFKCKQMGHRMSECPNP